MVSSFNKILEGVFKMDSWLSDQSRGRNTGQDYELDYLEKNIAGSEFSVISLEARMETGNNGKAQILAKKEEHMGSIQQKMFVPSKGQYPAFLVALELIENDYADEIDLHGKLIRYLGQNGDKELNGNTYEDILDEYLTALQIQFDEITGIKFSNSHLFLLDKEAIFVLIEIDKSTGNEVCPMFIGEEDAEGLKEALFDLMNKNDHNYEVSSEGKQTSTEDLLEEIKDEIRNSEWINVRKELGITGKMSIVEEIEDEVIPEDEIEEEEV